MDFLDQIGRLLVPIGLILSTVGGCRLAILAFRGPVDSAVSRAFNTDRLTQGEIDNLARDRSEAYSGFILLFIGLFAELIGHVFQRQYGPEAVGAIATFVLLVLVATWWRSRQVKKQFRVRLEDTVLKDEKEVVGASTRGESGSGE